MEKEDDEGVDLGLMDNFASLSWEEISALLNEVEQNGNAASLNAPPLDGEALKGAFDNDERGGTSWPLPNQHHSAESASYSPARAKRPLEADVESKSFEDRAAGASPSAPHSAPPYPPAHPGGFASAAAPRGSAYSSAVANEDHNGAAAWPAGSDSGLDLRIPPLQSPSDYSSQGSSAAYYTSGNGRPPSANAGQGYSSHGANGPYSTVTGSSHAPPPHQAAGAAANSAYAGITSPPSPATVSGPTKTVVRKPAPRASTVPETREDPAPPGALSFDTVHELLTRASRGDFAPDIQRRNGVSPVNPAGPKAFYVLDRAANSDVGTLYTDMQQPAARAVRLRSTKKLHWISPQHGLQYRELAQKERKTGILLDFGGCVYTLATRKSREAPFEIPCPSLQFLQVWYHKDHPGPNARGANLMKLSASPSPSLSQSPSPNASPAATAGNFDTGLGEGSDQATGSHPSSPATAPSASGATPGSTSKRHQVASPRSANGNGSPSFEGLAISHPTPTPRLGSSDEVERIAFEIYNRTCSSLDPTEWKSWLEKYGGFLRTDNFAKALRLYVKRDDPRLKEDFLFPIKQSMIEGLPVGNFRATLDSDVTANGGTCVYSDKVFNEIVGQNPVGMKGFFVSVLSPLQRLCMSRVWFKRIHEAGQSYLEYFQQPRITQGAFTLRSGEVKVLRSKNRLTRDETGDYLIEVQIQDVTHVYPGIVSLPPFLE